MRKLFYLLMILGTTSIHAQHDKSKDNTCEMPHKEEFSKKEQLLVAALGIKDEQRKSFSKVFHEYQQEHKKIKKLFNPYFEADTLSDKEALEKIHQSFIVGEKLMQNRNKYTEIFLKILSPQQVLKLFQIEGMIKHKIKEKEKKKDKD